MVVNPSVSPAVTLQRSVAGEDVNVDRELRLLFLGCESKPPYGPYEHTAGLFLDLLILSLQTIGATGYRVILDVYHASSGHFPSRNFYGHYDGIILPGSFSSAYDAEPWIEELSKIIQEELVVKGIPTLGVCFGHQLYAHSFDEGSAIKCPAGPQAGRKVSSMSAHGRKWFPTMDGLQLFYTHGDMVQKLPPQGRILCGTEAVPVQAAIYFSNHDEQKPIAVTFQAHPEYASSTSLGLHRTLNEIMEAMNERQDISDQELQRAKADAREEFEAVQQHSLETIITVGRLLGWFPMDN
jgi:GMP synthase-like glutamine amidotransferase